MAQKPKTPVFREVPKSLTDFRGWYNCVSDMRNYLIDLAVDRDTPGVVTLATPEAAGVGVQLHWTTTPKASSYHVIRGDTNNPNTSLVIAILPGRRNVSYFDPVGSSSSSQTLYYWIQPFNENVPGPLSNMGSIANPSLPTGGGALDLPFTGGPLGNGMHGAIHISADTSATAEVPIYQLTDLTVDSGKTWSGLSGQGPGGFIISCQGRCTIAGTITVAGMGGIGGVATTSANGYNGQIGFRFGGSGAGGGAGDVNSKGGHGGPLYKEFQFGNYDTSNIQRLSAQSTNWYGDSTTAPTLDQIRRESQANALNGGAGAFNELSTGGAGASITAFPSFTYMFPLLWALNPGKLFGWGGGGGSGGRAGSGTSGYGGFGGGCIVILCDELDFTGTISANGQAGGNGTGVSGGGGGGGGGLVLIGYRTLIANSGTITVTGGSAGTGAGGGSNGGAGGDGYSKVFDMRI